MYIVVIAWIYVVLMMSITEQSPVAGVMTFLFYGVVPVTIIVYLSGSSRRRRQQRQYESAAASKEEATDHTPKT